MNEPSFIDEPSRFAGPAPSSPLGHRLMFFLLTCLALAVFAPTVLLPILRDHCLLLDEERRLKDDIAELDGEIARLEELVYAFQNDAVINERLAVLDLRYKRPDEVIVPVLVSNPIARSDPLPRHDSPPRSALGLPDDWPAWALAAEAWADEKGLVSLFLDAGLRSVFLLMSGGLVIAAFVLFAPRSRRIESAIGAVAPPIRAP